MGAAVVMVDSSPRIEKISARGSSPVRLTSSRFNTHRLADKKWFHVLLWGGLAGYLMVLATLGIFWPTDVLGGLITWGVMIPYVIAGPDGMAVQQPQIATPTAPPKRKTRDEEVSHLAQEAVFLLPRTDFFSHFDCPRVSMLI